MGDTAWRRRCALSPENREKLRNQSEITTEPPPPQPYLLSFEKDHSLHFGINILTQLLFKFLPSITNVWHFNWAPQDHGHKTLHKKGDTMKVSNTNIIDKHLSSCFWNNYGNILPESRVLSLPPYPLPFNYRSNWGTLNKTSGLC